MRDIERTGKIILDLCGGTGSWSRPWALNGYDVRIITLPDHDVRTYEPPDGVYGILAAPPVRSSLYLIAWLRIAVETLRAAWRSSVLALES